MIDMGDHIRIKASDETMRLGLAGLEGTVFGWTTPSSTSVEVIGDSDEDFAINVNIEGVDKDLWFSSDLVEFIDHGAGTVISIDGSPVELVRLANGEWQERPKNS